MQATFGKFGGPYCESLLQCSTGCDSTYCADVHQVVCWSAVCASAIEAMYPPEKSCVLGDKVAILEPSVWCVVCDCS